jgi:hypothetical protein
MPAPCRLASEGSHVCAPHHAAMNAVPANSIERHEPSSFLCIVVPTPASQRRCQPATECVGSGDAIGPPRTASGLRCDRHSGRDGCFYVLAHAKIQSRCGKSPRWCGIFPGRRNTPAMRPMLDAFENTWISTTLRDSPNVFLYPTILAFHTLGLAFFVGTSSAIALRILGVASDLPMAPFKKLYPVMWLGFFFNAVSGALLLVIEPTKFLLMVDFYVKLLAIAGAVYGNRLLYVRRFRDPALAELPVRVNEKWLAVTILFLWAVSITAGRLTAYDDANTQWQTALGTLIVSTVLIIGGYVSVTLWRWVRHGIVS